MRRFFTTDVRVIAVSSAQSIHLEIRLVLPRWDFLPFDCYDSYGSDVIKADCLMARHKHLP